MKEKRIRDWNQSAVIETDPFLKSLTPNYNVDDDGSTLNENQPAADDLDDATQPSGCKFNLNLNEYDQVQSYNTD